MSLIKKKYRSTKKPVNPFALMFAQFGFMERTVFNWGNDNVFELHRKASRE